MPPGCATKTWTTRSGRRSSAVRITGGLRSAHPPTHRATVRPACPAGGATRKESSMPQGTIHGLQTVRGLGVIRPDDGSADLLFRRNALAAGGYEELRE